MNTRTNCRALGHLQTSPAKATRQPGNQAREAAEVPHHTYYARSHARGAANRSRSTAPISGTPESSVLGTTASPVLCAAAQCELIGEGQVVWVWPQCGVRHIPWSEGFLALLTRSGRSFSLQRICQRYDSSRWIAAGQDGQRHTIEEHHQSLGNPQVGSYGMYDYSGPLCVTCSGSRCRADTVSPRPCAQRW